MFSTLSNDKINKIKELYGTFISINNMVHVHVEDIYAHVLAIWYIYM